MNKDDGKERQGLTVRFSDWLSGVVSSIKGKQKVDVKVTCFLDGREIIDSTALSQNIEKTTLHQQ